MMMMSSRAESPGGPKESDIVKRGYLYIKRPPRHGILRFKTWHKRYFVLRDETSENSRRLEMFHREADFVKGGSHKLVLELENVVHVGRTADSKRFRQAFIIVCLGRSAVLLADEDSLSLNSWLLAVSLISGKGRSTPSNTTTTTNGHGYRPLTRRRSCELPDCLEGVPLNQCYSEMKLEDSIGYEVTIQPTEASNRNDLRGDYQLIVNSSGVSLLPMFRAGKDEVAIHWPLCYIRKYKNEMLGLSPKRKTTLVTLELGRRCASGEGVFKFRTQHGREVVTELTKVIAASMSKKMASDVNGQSRFSGNGQRGPWYPEEEAISLHEHSSSLLSTSDSHGSDRLDKNAILRSNSAKFTKVRESMTSSMSTTSSSNESAEYIMAAFSEKTQRLHFDTRSGLRVSRSTSDISACLNLTPLDSQQQALKQRAARAEAEGYLEVLPDYFEGERESEDRNNIYHNMDFTDKDSSSLKSPTEDTISELGGAFKEKEGSPFTGRRKPPAPLPRPEHTISSGRKSWNATTTPHTPTSEYEAILPTSSSSSSSFRLSSPPLLDWSAPLSPPHPLIPRVNSGFLTHNSSTNKRVNDDSNNSTTTGEDKL